MMFYLIYKSLTIPYLIKDALLEI